MLSRYPKAVVRKKLAASFRDEEILNATPDKLMIKVYDYVIGACNRKDRDKATTGLVQLIDSLNFDYTDEALGLLNLYRYCLKNLKEDGFDKVVDIMNQLKESWIEALNNPQEQNPS